MSAAMGIRVMPAAEAEARLGELAALLLDAVAHGASVNFMAGLTAAQARQFWRDQIPAIATGSRLLLVADTGRSLVGTVVVTFAHQPNAPHRAEIGKMLVLSTARRQGLGRRLLQAAEQAALAAGRTLLLLDSESGSAGALLYQACGWTEAGRIADHSYTPDGRLADATLFTKTIGPHRAPIRL